MTGQTIGFNRHIKHEFGAYTQTHEATDNTMRERTVGVIALRPTGNKQGSYYYLSLTTGRKLNRLRASELPMPQDVIDRVHTLARDNPAGLEFHDRYRQIIPDTVDFDHGAMDLVQADRIQVNDQPVLTSNI